jgi:hypothetical protein
MPGFLRASASIIAVVVAAAALIAGPLVIPSVSTTNMAHVEALWKDYIVAQKRLQFDLARLLSDDRPDLEGVADLQRDQEFAMIELRDMRFQYLLVFDPDRLVYKDGLDEFIDFEWSDADNEALRDSNPDYLKLERWTEMNAKRLSGYPGLVEVDDRLMMLQGDDRYQTMIEHYRTRMDDLESALDSIAKAKKRAEQKSVQKAQSFE